MRHGHLRPAPRRRRARVSRCLVALGLLLVAASPGGDPLRGEQWHLDRVGLPDAWRGGTGAGVVIAVLDTGVDAAHPDLTGQVVPGVDLVDRGTPAEDVSGHGTLVAGVAAAVADNALGGAGVAPAAKIMPVRVLDEHGKGTGSLVAEGIRWATEHGADVINLSLAEAPAGDPAALITLEVELAIEEAAARGVLVIAAAGNDGRHRNPYRPDLPVLVIGATDRADRVWASSNRAEDVLFAPGAHIVGPYRDGGYAAGYGTSFAAPIASAAGALLLDRGLSADEARRRLVATAVDIGAGRGLLDAAAAVGVRRGTPTAAATHGLPSEEAEWSLPRVGAVEPQPGASTGTLAGEDPPPGPLPPVTATREGFPAQLVASARERRDPHVDVQLGLGIALASALLAADLVGLLAATQARSRR